MSKNTQTAIEWLAEQYEKSFTLKVNNVMTSIIEQAKEMEKQQIIDAAERWKGTDFAEKYYAETYGSKGSDVEKLAEIEYPIFDGDLLGIAHNQKHSRIDFIKGYNKAKETLYTEEQVIEFTKWLASEWFSMWVKDKFVWEHDWEENQEGQKYQGYYTEKQLLDLFQSLKNKL